MTTDPTAADAPISPAEGRHLCAVLAAQFAGETPVRTGTLADRLGVAAATVTETVKRFADDGLVRYEPYAGVELTDHGEELAREMLWRRCVIQRFFAENAGVELGDGDAYQISLSVPEDGLAALGAEYTDCLGRCEASEPEECGWLAV